MRKPLLILLCLILAGIFFSYGNTLKKNIEVRKQINLFLKRSEEYSQQFYDTDINGTTIKYTTVSRETKEKKIRDLFSMISKRACLETRETSW